MQSDPTNEQVEREEIVFEAARQLRPDERADYLDKTCANEPELRQRVEGLLNALERAGGLLNAPAFPAPPKALVPSPSVSEQAGEKIGRYKLLQRIGEGGCGVVYMAEQEEPVHRRVALKIIKPGMDTKSLIARFEAERQALAMMDHPNIAKFFDAGVTETGRPYFVMELVRGSRITDYCDQNELETTARLDLFMQICRAVQHAHQKGIIHRDLKPSNILITSHDGIPVPKVIDFGVAKAVQGRLTDQTVFTAFEQFIGTPAYMSPEQAELSGLDIDTRSDIYSLGVLLYELLTGKTPFDAKELVAGGLDQMRQTIREQEPVRPSTRLSTMMAGDLATAARQRRIEAAKLVNLVRGDLDWIVLKCLEKVRTRRYETANGLAMDIHRHLSSEPVVARPPSGTYRLQKLIHRNKLAFATATTVGAALLLGVSISTWQAVRARHAERTARRAETVAIHSLYAANMRLAQYAWGQNAASQVRKVLEETETYPARGFEWFYWQRQTHLQLATLRGHQAPVLGVASSSNGQWLATVSYDGTARVWELSSGNLLRTLNAHNHPVSSVAFSPDGHRIVTGSWGRTAKVWEWASGKPLRTLTGHTGEVFSVAFSTDGGRIVTGSRDHTAKVWNATNGHEVFTIRGHSNWVWSAAFADDGRYIVTGSHDHTAKVWDAATGKELRTFSGHSGPVYSVALSPDGQRLATGSEDLTVRVWDLARGSELFRLRGHSGPVHSVAFSRDGQRIATGSFDQTAKVWDGANGTELFAVRSHGSPLSSIALSADGGRLITGGGSVGITPQDGGVFPGLGDNTAKVWSVSGEGETLTLTGHTSKVMAVAFSADSRRIITGGLDKTAIVWEADSGKALFNLKGHNGMVRGVAFSPDGQRIVTGSFDGTARVWSASEAKVLAEFTGHTDIVMAVAFSPDGQRIVTGSRDQTARVWSAIDGKQLAILEGHSAFIISVAFSPDGERIATASDDLTTAIWESATGSRLCVIARHDRPPKGVAFFPDGQRIVTCGEEGTAAIWESATGKKLLTLAGHAAEVYAVAVSPDGQRVVTAGKDRTAKIWDASNGRELLTLTGHRDSIFSTAFSPDNQRIVTGSWDGTAKVWQAASREQVLRWRAEEQAAQDPQLDSNSQAITK